MRESEFIRRSGVPAKTVKKLREEHLEPSTHYIRRGRGIVLNEAGIRYLCALCDIEDLPPPQEDPAAPGELHPPDPKDAAAPPVLDLKVERMCPNPTWVRARLGGKLVDVRVGRHGHRVRPGSVLQGCREDPNKAGRYLWR